MTTLEDADCIKKVAILSAFLVNFLEMTGNYIGNSIPCQNPCAAGAAAGRDQIDAISGMWVLADASGSSAPRRHRARDGFY
jgi:hypothetical protein